MIPELKKDFSDTPIDVAKCRKAMAEREKLKLQIKFFPNAEDHKEFKDAGLRHMKAGSMVIIYE